MPTLPVLWIWFLNSHIEITPRPLSFRYDNPYGFLMDFFLIFSGRSLIDMTPTFFRIGMIMTAILLSRWLNSPIEMTATSYWYEGKERGFLTLCYLSIWVSFFLSLIQKIWRSLVSFWRVNSYAKWPFILGTENTLNGTANPRPKTLNLLSFQSDRRFLKKILLKSY